MTLRSIAALVLVAAVGAGSTALSARAGRQTPGPASPSTPPRAAGTAVIIGRVVDATSGAPVDDAVVTLKILGVNPNATSAGEGRSTEVQPVPVLVNGRGQFVFNNLPAGAALVTTSAAGYMDGGSGVRVPGGDPVAVTLTEGQHLPDVTIRLWRYAAIEGGVFDETGDAIAGVQVRLLQRTAGERRLLASDSTTTDDRGAFRFSSLDPGRYVVLVPSTTTSLSASVADDYFAQLNENVSPLVRGPVTASPQPSAPGFRVGDSVLQPSTSLARSAPPPTPDGRIQIYRTTFYPAATSAAQAASLDVAAGDTRTGVNLTLPLVSTVAVSGVVSDIAAGHIANLQLALTPAETSDWLDADGFDAALTTTDEDGAFTFLGVPPGQYVIRTTEESNGARAREVSDARQKTSEVLIDDYNWLRAPVSVGDKPIAHLSLVARIGLSVAGRVRFAGSSQPPSLADVLLSLVQLNHSGQPQPIGVTKEGRLAIAGCEPGHYAIDAPPLTNNGVTWTVASVTANGRDILTQPLDLESDVSDVVVTFTDHPTEIAGRVLSAGRQDEPLVVVAFPADYQAAEDSGLLGRRAATVEVTSGRYAIDGLPPGNYLLASIPASELSIWMDAGSIRSIAMQASAVTLAERSHLTVDLNAIEIR